MLLLKELSFGQVSLRYLVSKMTLVQFGFSLKLRCKPRGY